jgi:alpha-glucosidase
MKNGLAEKIVWLIPASLLLATEAVGQSNFELQSPDQRITITIRVADRIRYDVLCSGRPLLQDSTLSLTIDGKPLGANPTVKSEKRGSYDQWEEPVVRRKSAKIHDHYNELRLEMDGNYTVAFRAYNEGVAYRFETRLPQNEVKVNGEESIFSFPTNETVYYPKEDSFFSHNERLYLPVALKDIAPASIATLPAVVFADHGVKLAIAESDIEDYPGMWLKGTGDNALAATFPPYPLKEHLERDRDFKVTEAADYIAITNGTRTFPWRLVGIAEKDGDLITNQLAWLLERPSELTDTTWIKPGKVAWDWWNANNVYGVDFKSGVNTETYKYYIDFAAKYGLQYVILDEGWYKLGNVLDVVPEINMEELTSYARQKNVGIILWVIWKTLDDQLEAALDQYQKWGVKGIKVDFLQRDDQLMIRYVQKVCRETAKRKMLVDFHGIQRSALMTRTWPNLISNEGVRGNEWSKWSADASPPHNVTLPFTRMFLGPMDYTPGAMLNASQRSFAPIFDRPMSLGTRCHQLAMYVVFESPLQMLSDSPSNYMREPEAMEFLSPVPTTWDETRVLDAKLANYVVVARRSGKEWYIGAMTDWTPRDLEIDLLFLPQGTFTMDSYQDGVNADRMSSDYRKETRTVDQNTLLKVRLAEGGGWAARIR